MLLNTIAFNLNQQVAFDAPRVCNDTGMPDQGIVLDMAVYLEEGILYEVREGLTRLGHGEKTVREYERAFRTGQLIQSHVEDGLAIHSGGSDPCGDGAAYPA